MDSDIVSSPAITRSSARHSFRFGIEEEFFLVDKKSGRVASTSPSSLFTLSNIATSGLVDREFLQSQIEATTPPFSSAKDARNELAYVRGVLARFAAFHGLELAACGTHPLAQWASAQQSSGTRYDVIMAELQMVGRRNMCCGMHVHVEVPDPERRVALMGQISPFLPLFLALSASSPFWQGRKTGLKAYRMAAYSELPRSGLPELFTSAAEYDAYVKALVESGAIEDAGYIWWMARPSHKYPTLELRAPDSCTRIRDAIALASLYRALVRYLSYAPIRETAYAEAERALAVDNKWQAQRHGLDAVFATLDGPKSVAVMLDDVIAMVRDDADELGCRSEVEDCRLILDEGTSADEQLREYERSSAEGLAAVSDWLAKTTLSPV